MPGKKNVLLLIYALSVLTVSVCLLIFAYRPVNLYIIFPLNILLTLTCFLVMIELMSGLIYVSIKNAKEAKLKMDVANGQIENGSKSQDASIKIAVNQDCPSLACIIAAYLPNEEEVIEETITHLLEKVFFPSSCSHKIILAYNTPHDMPAIENRLMELQNKYSPRFICVRVMGSTSKAHNINYVLEHILSGETAPDVCAIFDADHKPAEDAIGRALRHFQNDPNLDILQGRCVVTNRNESWISYIVGAEFDYLYGIIHTGRSLVYNFAFFGGTNGYWKYNVLREIEFKTNMLTEDVDASMRSLRENKKTRYDYRIVSRELAPVTFSSFLKQRSRWAQGWFQVTMKRFLPVFSKVKGLRRKMGVFFLLVFREFGFHISFLLLLLQLSMLLLPKSITEPHGQSLFSESWQMAFRVQSIIIWTFTGLMIVITFVSLLVVRTEYTTIPQATLFTGIVFFLNLLNVYMAIQSQIAETLKQDKWIVTPRSKKKVAQQQDNVNITNTNEQVKPETLDPIEVKAENIDIKTQNSIDGVFEISVDA